MDGQQCGGSWWSLHATENSLDVLSMGACTLMRDFGYIHVLAIMNYTTRQFNIMHTCLNLISSLLCVCKFVFLSLCSISGM